MAAQLRTSVPLPGVGDDDEDAAALGEIIPGLPEEVALQCIARVSRAHHPKLSLVSSPWRSLLRSPLLFSTRARLLASEFSLCLSLRLHAIRSSLWYTLDGGASPPRLRALPPLPSPAAFTIGSAAVALGPKIYLLGGSVGHVPSPNVWIYDAVTNRWEAGRRMRVGREFCAVGAAAGKIYVIGGCVVNCLARSVNWAEVFDPGPGTWAAVPSPSEAREKWMQGSAVVEGRVYVMGERGGAVLDPREGAWEGLPAELEMGWRGGAAAVGGVLYCYDFMGRIRGYLPAEGRWEVVQGLEGLPRFLCGAAMAGIGGRLAVVWQGKAEAGRRATGVADILCAEIQVGDSGGELWGSVVWSGAVHSAPADSAIVHCSAVEL